MDLLYPIIDRMALLDNRLPLTADKIKIIEDSKEFLKEFRLKFNINYFKDGKENTVSVGSSEIVGGSTST